MNDACPQLETCRFLKSCDDNLSLIKESWLNLYCLESGKYQTCARLKYIAENQAMPPDSLMPTGSIIE